MKPDFSKLKYTSISEGGQSTGSVTDDVAMNTPEGIPVQAAYGAEALQGLEHLGFGAGVAPYLRGPYSTMYVTRPWTIRQYAGFSTAEESNAFYRRNL
ncbi:MAG: methylmalonyl-CoA mutase, partial [Leptospiraceae bacterium]|nr:methylmalonyl-CoA mutase [Leptospiraceae bacterium]